MKKTAFLLFVVLAGMAASACRGKEAPPAVPAAELPPPESLPPPAEARDSGGDAFQYRDRGLLLYEAGDLPAAIESFEAAKRLQPEISFIREVLGNWYLEQGGYDAAAENYNEALRLSNEMGMEGNPALYAGLGYAHYHRGNYNASIENFNKAVQLDSETETEETAALYACRGNAYYYRGSYDAAIEDYGRAIALDADNPLFFNTRGEARRARGDYGRAIADFTEAIKIKEDYANAWNNLGLAHYGGKNYGEAIRSFNRAIEIDASHARAWNNRGSVYLDMGDYGSAVADFTRALALDTGYDYAVVYSNRARAYRNSGEYGKALADCGRALEINPNLAPALNNRAHTYREMNEYQKALADYRECLDKARDSVNINDISVYAWYLAAQIYEKYPCLKGDILTHDFWSQFAGRLALAGIGRGIARAEDIRRNMGTYGAGLMTRMIYLYYAGVDFEVNLGTAENAFFYSESLRSRGFLEQVGTEAAIRLNGVTPEERGRFTALRNIIREQQAIIDTHDPARAEGGAGGVYAGAVERRVNAENALAALDKAIGGRVPKYASLRNPKPATLDEAMAYCGDDRAVLEYVIWDDAAYTPVKGYESWDLKGGAPSINSYCLVITKDSFAAVQLNPGFDYSGAIKKLRESFENQNPYAAPDTYEEPRAALYRQLIKPVLPYLRDIKNITIVPDGELALIPFDILGEKNGEDANYLGESCAISLSPSVSVSILARKDEKTPRSPLLFFANDTYAGSNDPDGYPLDDLPGVKREIDALKKLADAQGLEVGDYFREDASEENIKRLSALGELKKYPVIHFACHGHFDRKNSAGSGLILFPFMDEAAPESGNDAYLTIAEVAALDLNAGMVILSACETGLGETEIGEGMVGLVRAFLAAGAGNVGVSLWKINDTATSSFMERVYRKTLEEGKHFTDAYKEVKESFRDERIGQRRRPYYWAAFTVYE